MINAKIACRLYLKMIYQRYSEDIKIIEKLYNQLLTRIQAYWFLKMVGRVKDLKFIKIIQISCSIPNSKKLNRKLKELINLKKLGSGQGLGLSGPESENLVETRA